MAPVIEIRPMGNLGNRMIQYLAARRLQADVAGSAITSFALPEWGIEEPARGSPGPRTLTVRPEGQISYDALRALCRSGAYDRVVLAGFMQLMDYLPTAELASRLFQASSEAYSPAPDELLINIRASELVLGIGHYPLVPIDFYARIARLTGLRPVFMGQIGGNRYCQALRGRFPEARFLSSQGPIGDFETIRRASHIVPSVSTFSWLAAWMSKAVSIHLPMIGFLNPMHFGGARVVDLLPIEDGRYRFFLFPLHHGVPEEQDLPVHAALDRACVEISPRQVAALRAPARLADIETCEIDFDPIWYVHAHLDAATDISNGWVATPLAHYLEIGRRRGLRPVPEGFSISDDAVDRSLADLSAGRPCAQSTISQWSVGATPEEDAARAVRDEIPSSHAFHTELEDHPWWRVDLGDGCRVAQITVHNRSEPGIVPGRSTPLACESSLDGEAWTERFVTPDGFIPGTGGRPMVWTAPATFEARFVRLSVRKRTYLHLRRVRILGHPARRTDASDTGDAGDQSCRS